MVGERLVLGRAQETQQQMEGLGGGKEGRKQGRRNGEEGRRGMRDREKGAGERAGRRARLDGGRGEGMRREGEGGWVRRMGFVCIVCAGRGHETIRQTDPEGGERIRRWHARGQLWKAAGHVI